MSEPRSVVAHRDGALGIPVREEHPDPTSGVCAQPGCAAEADQAAPVELCSRHLRLAFAFVLEAERPDLADKADAQPYWAPEARATGWVYFIRLGDLVKIGYSRNPTQRFYALQPSEVLHLEPGTMADERRCHVAFDHLRVEGELFRPDPDLLAFIADLQRKQQAA